MNREQIAARIPHAGAMCLLDEAVTWDATCIHCRSQTHQNQNNPLRRRGHLAAVQLVEYAAQAAALHSGLQQSGDGSNRGGMLAGLRGVRLTAGDMQAIDGPVDIRARMEMSSAAGMIYSFAVDSAARSLVTGQVTIILL